jgi:hypothetical protein
MRFVLITLLNSGRDSWRLPPKSRFVAFALPSPRPHRPGSNTTESTGAGNRGRAKRIADAMLKMVKLTVRR